jgi:S-adenosylmethionine uptake transporter
MLAGSTVAIIGGYIFSVLTMRRGEIGFIAPFRYTSLVFALILGYLVFDEWPDAVTLAGAALVVATGLFTFLRERRVGRGAAAARPVGRPR